MTEAEREYITKVKIEALEITTELLAIVSGKDYTTSTMALSMAFLISLMASPDIETITDAIDKVRAFPAVAERTMIPLLFGAAKEASTFERVPTQLN